MQLFFTRPAVILLCAALLLILAARGIVLDSGKTIAAGSVREIMTAENVRAAYFGALP